MLSSCGLTAEARASNKIKMDGLLSIWNRIEFEISRFVSSVWRVYNAFKVLLISTQWKAMESTGINLIPRVKFLCQRKSRFYYSNQSKRGKY